MMRPGIGRGRVARLVALLLHRGGQLGDGLVRALGVDHEHEGQIAGGGGDLQRLADIDRRVLEQVHARRDRGAGEGIEHVAVGLRARDELGRDVASWRPSLFSTMMVRPAIGRSFSAK